MNESPAELLERAAACLEELARHFDDYVRYVDTADDRAGRFDSPVEAWHYDNTESLGNRGALKWIETMSPAVAAPLVAWLRHTAEEGDLVAPYYEYVKAAQDALDFARQILLVDDEQAPR